MKRLKVGDKLTLSATLFDGDTALYVKASLFDADTLAAITTINLTHLAGGIYKDNSITTVARKTYLVIYVVYTDAGYTVPSVYHMVTEEFIDVSDIEDRIQSTENNLTNTIDLGDGHTA